MHGHTYQKTSALTFFHLVKVPVHSACLSHLCQLKDDAVPVEKLDQLIRLLNVLRTSALWLIGSVLSGQNCHTWSRAVIIVTVEVNDLNNDGLDAI